MIVPSGGSGPTTRPRTLPLFPLHTVLLPGVHLPLHVFEPRYRQLTVDLVTKAIPDRLFGVVAIRTRAVHEVEQLDQVHAIGCTAQLREATRRSDGQFDLITTGHRRFRLLDVDTHRAPYLIGTVEWVDDTTLPEDIGETAARLNVAARVAHQRYCTSAWEQESWDTPPADVGISELAYLLAADCLLPLADRQALLEQRHPLYRLRTISRLLTREAGFLSQLQAVPIPYTELDEAMSRQNLN